MKLEDEDATSQDAMHEQPNQELKHLTIVCLLLVAIPIAAIGLTHLAAQLGYYQGGGGEIVLLVYGISLPLVTLCLSVITLLQLNKRSGGRHLLSRQIVLLIAALLSLLLLVRAAQNLANVYL